MVDGREHAAVAARPALHAGLHVAGSGTEIPRQARPSDLRAQARWAAVHSPGPTDVTGILALSATSVYATGTDAGAALLLHYNSKAGSRVWERGAEPLLRGLTPLT